MAQQTRLQKIVDEMIIKDEVLCMGDIQHNTVIQETFAGVKSNKFNLQIAEYVKSNLVNSSHNWYWYVFTKTQLKKLNAIMKAKSKETLQKRVYAFAGMITSGYYSHLFNKAIIKSWIELCKRNNLKHGLVKVNRQKLFETQLNNMLQNL